MGEDAIGNEASPEQLAEMVQLLHESLDAGGIGFSTTLSYTHSDGDGKPVASRWANREELLALCKATGEHEGTTLEAITDGCLDTFSDDEIELFTAMSVAAQRPLNWNVLTVDSQVPERVDEAARGGQRGGGRRRPTRRADDAGARPDEHELPHALRAVPDAGLERSDGAPGPGAHRASSRSEDARVPRRARAQRGGRACCAASPTGATT